MCKLDEGQRAFAEDNIKFVYFVLNKMGVSRCRYDYDDLFGAGCVGLCNAVRVWRKDESAFSTFAFHVIKNEVLSVLIAHGRDKCKLTSLDELYESNSISASDNGFEEMEADMLIEEFCRCASLNLGETSEAVVRLSVAGKDCNQIAKTLGMSISAVDKAKKRARTAIDIWLSDRLGAQWKQ